MPCQYMYYLSRQSCEGDPFDVRKEASYHIANSYGMTCGVEGCRWASFELDSDTGGSVECSGIRGCESSEIMIQGPAAVECDGLESCQHAHIVVMNPVPEVFAITCSGI